MTKILKRRRLEQKTDYKARLAFLKSGKPRLVIRKTNRYLIVQIIESHGAQDKVISGITSKSLLSKGWPKESEGSLKTIPAAYLTGFILGKSVAGKVKELIVDLGMNRNIHKSRLYAVLKGVIDAGIKVPHSSEALPSMERITSYPKLGKLVEAIKK